MDGRQGRGRKRHHFDTFEVIRHADGSRRCRQEIESPCESARMQVAMISSGDNIGIRQFYLFIYSVRRVSTRGLRETQYSATQVTNYPKVNNALIFEYSQAALKRKHSALSGCDSLLEKSINERTRRKS